MGRKPAKNPKQIHLGVRIDEQTATALDAEIVREKAERPGSSLTRGEMVRRLIAEALVARSKQRK